MKYIAHWTKWLVISGVIALTACSSGPKKKDVQQASFEGAAVTSSSRVSQQINVNPLLKKDYEQALSLMKKGELLQAETLLKQIVEKDNTLSGPYINLGIIRLKEGALAEAETLFATAREKNSRNPEIYNYLGIIYRQQGRFNDAEQAYKKAISINPMFSKAYLNLGVLYDLYLINYPAALASYKQYQIFNPEDKRVENWIVDLNQRMRAGNS